MAKMNNLSFDDGFKSFTVNGDKNRIIRFNPADPEILNRLVRLQMDFNDYQPEQDFELNPDGTPRSDLEKEAAYVAEFSNAMRKAINKVFNADVYDVIFNGQSPLCVVGGEKYLFEAVFDGMIGLMRPAMEAHNKASEKKMAKYLRDVK